MSSSIKWHGRKFSGSPVKLQKKAKKRAIKQNKLVCDDPSKLEGNILFGWRFQCLCGAKGDNYDDGKRSLQCDVCQLWMHNRCNGVPEKYDDLMIYFSRLRVWVCPSCKQGNYKYKGQYWNVPGGEINRRVTFEDPDYSELVEQKQTQSNLTIREQKIAQQAVPMLRRRNAGSEQSIKDWQSRRNAECGSSLKIWLAHQQREKSEASSEESGESEHSESGESGESGESDISSSLMDHFTY